MTTVGFNEPLYILHFDHRGSFQTKMFGWSGTLSSAQRAEIAAAILRDATAHGYTTACPAEKSGQEEFDFEYGEEFAQHVETFQPTFCKVLVRYNPERDHALNQRQANRLRTLSDYLHNGGRSKFMFELLVPAEESQLDQVSGDKKAYDLQLRPRLMTETIMQLQDAGGAPNVWKIEGLDRRDDCEKIVAVARRGHRENVEWLTTAATVDGGRTNFWDALVDMRAQKITREAAVAEIARRNPEYVGIVESARSESHASVS